MSKVLLIGHIPPQLIQGTKIEAAHYRTGQFVEPLLDDQHTVCLCAPPPQKDREVTVPAEWQGKFTYRPVPYNHLGWVGKLQQIADQFEPDCVVAVNFDACLWATKLRTDRPIWMDIYGDYLTIMQAARFRRRSNRGIPTSILFMKEVLRKADKVSVCSTTQRHMAVGELAMSNRLIWETFGYEFTEVIPAGYRPIEVREEALAAARKFRADANIGDDDFVVLWSGGYNTWTDVQTLFQGLEYAMRNSPKVHYVSVGESTYRDPNNVYVQLQRMIEGSPNRSRYHLLGWQPWSELQQYYLSANAGLNIDAIHYETIYGTRTRLLEMIAYRLPILTSLGTELSYDLQKNGLSLVFEIGNYQQFGEQILCLVNDAKLRSAMAEQASEYAEKHFTFYASTSALRQWVKDPTKAPDHVSEGSRSRQRQEMLHSLRSKLRFSLWKSFGLDK